MIIALAPTLQKSEAFSLRVSKGEAVSSLPLSSQTSVDSAHRRAIHLILSLLLIERVLRRR